MAAEPESEKEKEKTPRSVSYTHGRNDIDLQCIQDILVLLLFSSSNIPVVGESFNLWCHTRVQYSSTSIPSPPASKQSQSTNAISYPWARQDRAGQEK